MERFTRVQKGYNPSEVNQFLDPVISQVGVIIRESKAKEMKIKELESKLAETEKLQEKLSQYQRMEQTLTKAIYMTQKTTDQMKVNAHKEADMIIEEAKKNANRIVNESLIRAEKTENEANNLTKNIYIFKKRLRNIIESQLEMVNDIDKIEL